MADRLGEMKQRAEKAATWSREMLETLGDFVTAGDEATAEFTRDLLMVQPEEHGQMAADVLALLDVAEAAKAIYCSGSTATPATRKRSRRSSAAARTASPSPTSKRRSTGCRRARGIVCCAASKGRTSRDPDDLDDGEDGNDRPDD